MGFDYVLSGALGGLLIGMTGVGGGSLMTPLLVSGFGLAPATAIGTDLVYAALTKAGAVYAHQRQRHVAWGTALWLLTGSLPGALLTLALLHHFPPSHTMDKWLRHGLSLSLLLTALALWQRRPRPTPAINAPPATGRQYWTPIVGFLIGILVTLSSVGGGALGTALLLALYPNLSFPRVVGTELAHAVPLTLIAGLGHWQQGHVDTMLLFSLLAGSLPGLWLGTRLNHHLPESVARRGLTLLLLGLSITLW